VKVITIAALNLRRMFRVRSNIFFVIIMPMMLILLLGSMFGSGLKPRIGIVDDSNGDLSAALLERINSSDELILEYFDDEDAVIDAVSEGKVSAGLIIPYAYESEIRIGNLVVIKFIARPDTGGTQLRASVNSAVAGQAEMIRSGLFVASELGISQEEAGVIVRDTAPRTATVQVNSRTEGESLFGDAIGQFDLGSSAQLLLFIFIASLTGSASLVETRRFGVSTRMLSTPTSITTILMGEVTGRFTIALTQGLIIMFGSALLFGVTWGNPIAAAAVMLSFSLVGAGAGMLVGSVAKNDQQASSIGLGLGLGMAAIGGSMVPLEIFPETMKTIAHVTPHAWGNGAFAELLQRGGSIQDVAREIGVLLGYAAVLLVTAMVALRRTLTR